MSEGIRATVEFPTPTPCTIAELSRSAGSVVDDVWRSVPTDGAPCISEFLIEAESPPEAPSVDHVLSIGNRHLLRLTHDDDGVSCPCECLGQHGCAVQRYSVRSGILRIVFNARDFEELRAVMEALRERFPDVDVRRLVRAPDAEETRDVVFVDRGKLTARQQEVLRTAYRMGYFERPRGANATEVAAELGVNPSTFTEHLLAAQRKILGDILEDGS